MGNLEESLPKLAKEALKNEDDVTRGLVNVCRSVQIKFETSRSKCIG